LDKMNELKYTAYDVLIEPVINNVGNFSELYLRLNYDGTVLDFTANTEHDLFTPSNYFLGKKIKDILPEKVHPKFEDAIYYVIKKNSVRIFQYSIKINDRVKFYKAKFFPSVNKQVIVIINEVTRSKKVVSALRETESKFKSVWENSLEGMRLINSKGIIVAVNNAFCRMFEMEESELIGKPFNIVYKHQKGGTFDESHKLFQQRFTEHNIENFLELKVVLRKGRTIFLEIVNTFIESNSPLNNSEQSNLLLSIFRDITERKKSESAKASLAAIVDSSNDAILGCSLHGIINNWNNAAEQLYGFVTSEIKGNSFLRILPEINPAQFRKILDKIKSNRRVEHYETKALKKDGTTFYTSITISPIKNSEGIITGFSAIVRDITERKKSEEVLIESEDRYRRLIETSPDAIALFDLKGKIVMGNIQLAKTFGFKNKKEFSNKTIFDLIGKDENRKILFDARHIIDHGTLKNVQYTLYKKEGESFSAEVSASVINDASGVAKGILCIFRDITERTKAELALKRSEEQFRSVWENSSEGMRLSNQEGKIVAVNEAFCKLTGFEEKEIIGKYFYELYDHYSSADLEKYARRFTKNNASRSQQSQFTFKSGKTLDLDITYSLIVEKDNPLLLSIFHDITEAKRSERELRKTEKLAAIGKMAAYLAHEIKTPLASIKINIDMMSKTLSLPKDKQRSFAIIQKEVKRLQHLLKNVLQYSRQVDLVFMDINLHNLINSIKQLFEPVLEQKEVTLLNKIPEDVFIIGDYQKLQTVFSHMLENAVEAVKRGDRIEIYSKVLPGNEKIEIFVKDCGCGIKNIPQAFEPFFTTKNSGTGLGLSIAQKLIEQHNGIIEIYSSRPGETIFRIILNMSRKNYGNYTDN
jgi:two-component system, sporulation sensor kinase A